MSKSCVGGMCVGGVCVGGVCVGGVCVGGKREWGGSGKNHYANKWKRGFFLYCSFRLNGMTITALDKSITQPQRTIHGDHELWRYTAHSVMQLV